MIVCEAAGGIRAAGVSSSWNKMGVPLLPSTARSNVCSYVFAVLLQLKHSDPPQVIRLWSSRKHSFLRWRCSGRLCRKSSQLRWKSGDWLRWESREPRWESMNWLRLSSRAEDANEEVGWFAPPAKRGRQMKSKGGWASTSGIAGKMLTTATWWKGGGRRNRDEKRNFYQWHFILLLGLG